MIQEKNFFGLNKIAFILIVALSCECAAGSSGRWLEFGELSIRMVLFIIAFLISIPFLIQNIGGLLKNPLLRMVLAFCFFLCFSLIYGLVRGNNPAFILGDLKSFLFLLIIPCYIVLIKDGDRLSTILKFVNYTIIALAIIMIALHFVLRYMSLGAETEFNYIINRMELGGFFNFGDGIYRIYFRSSVCLIIPFLYNLNLIINTDKSEKKRQVAPYIFMALSLIAIILTYTRSIWLGFVAAALLFVIFNIGRFRTIVKALAIAVAGFAVFVMISWVCYGFEGVVTNAVTRVVINQEYLDENEYDPSRFEQLEIQINSNDVREERLRAVYSKIKENWVFGSGLGQDLEVKGYGGKIEYTYLDILSKMGIFGFLSFCLLIFSPFYFIFKRNMLAQSRGYAGVMACALAGICVSSIFNPFITSPIGLSVYALLAAILFRQDFDKPAAYSLVSSENESLPL
jgi:O-Antigen ligase.